MNNNTNRIAETILGEDFKNCKNSILTGDLALEVAYHEAGHYVVKQALNLSYMMDTFCISILPTEFSLGANWYSFRKNVPRNPKMYEDMIASILGGKMATEIIGLNLTSCEDDLRRAYEIAYEYATKYYTDENAENQVLKIIVDIGTFVKQLLKDNKERLDLIAQALLSRKVLLGTEARALYDGTLTIEELEPLDLD